jgi:hypothetical protein
VRVCMCVCSCACACVRVFVSVCVCVCVFARTMVVLMKRYLAHPHVINTAAYIRAKVHAQIRCAIRRMDDDAELPAPRVIVGVPDVVGRVIH